MVGFQEIELNPGQFIFGRNKCAEETGLSEQNIRTCVQFLNPSELTIKPTNKFSVGTIINWGGYQSDKKENNQQITNNQPASNQQVTTNKNDKNDKNDKKKIIKKKFVPPTEKDVINYFHEKGYKTNIARKVFEYYNIANWKDATGKPVKNWKQKMIAVWFKDENKDTTQPEKSPLKICQAGPCQSETDKKYCKECQIIINEAGCKTYEEWKNKNTNAGNVEKLADGLFKKIE